MKSSTSCLDSATPGDSAQLDATLAEMAARKQAPRPEDRDEPLTISLGPEDALRGLVRVEPVITAEDMARKHGLDGLSLRNMLRDNPRLTPGHRHRDEYEITPEIERAIIAHPDFQGVKRR